ncbi:MAG: ribosome maturation factor RimP [Clostridia bacterium]|nr:ribosome maturation factor RimP [Clostridia bacterium]
MEDIVKKVSEFLSPIVEKVGYELVDVTYKKEYGNMTLTVYVWKKGGISLDDCECVHNAITGPLDELNPTGEVAYHLNVSSPGLDRPIVSKRDYERNLGEEIELIFKAPVQGKKKIDGRLVDILDTDEIVLEIKNSVKFTVKKDTISVARPLIRF